MTEAEIVAAIEARRVAIGWSVAKLAREAGMWQPNVSRLLSGSRASPQLETILRLAAAMDLEVTLTDAPRD
ncbi:MAG: helix-turn-helix transcriptional regulator [Phycisphaerales bacterium]